MSKLQENYVQIIKDARWMDIVGDYAGDELFIIDGESLLQTVLDDDLLAIGRSTGCDFQAAHAIYILEAILENFISRQARFEIIFFQLTIPVTTLPGSEPFVYRSRELARLLLQKHLHLVDIPVLYFENLQDPAWIEHEQLEKPMLVLMKDHCIVPKEVDQDARQYTRVLQRQILDYLASGLSVGILNGIQFRDSKILTFIIESGENIRLQEAESADKAESPPSSIQVQERPFIIDRDDLLVQCCRCFGSLQGKPLNALLWLFVCHVVYMDKLPFRFRAQKVFSIPHETVDLLRNQFLPVVFGKLAALILESQASIDIDGRVFTALVGLATNNSFNKHLLEQTVGPLAYASTQHIWGLAELPSALPIVALTGTSSTPSYDAPSSNVSLVAPLLPFSHPVLDGILSSVQVVTQPDEDAQQAMFFDFSKRGVWFDDRFHWHVQKEILPVRGAALLSWKARKAKERFMNALQQQAETLTGASGLGLRRIAIVATGSDKEKSKAVSTVKVSSRSKAKEKPPSKKELLLQKIADEKMREKNEENLTWLLQRLKELKALSTHDKIERVEKMRLNPRAQQSLWLGTEFNLFMLHLTLLSWIEHPDQEASTIRDEFTVNIMQQIQTLSVCGPFTSDRAAAITTVLRVLGFASYSAALAPVMEKDVGAAMVFKLVKLERTSGPLFPWMKITEHPLRWQLRVFGPYMDRSMDAAYDKRVDFKPDGWQRQALDCIDDPKHSMLVVAPTSAGKTFISFYAMEKVLRHSNDSILVYIAPTKALVNQIAAEVYARYSKNLTNGGLWAIHTRDYRINDPQNCQILVTVPEILAIMLLSPPLARKWTHRLKRIILDEIHTIGQQEGGSIWEQLILLAPCPIIGLSATVGSPEKFNAWLETIADAHNWEHSFIHYQHRYSHLRKFLYQSDVKRQLNGSNFDGLSSHSATDRLYFLHPISLLSFGERTLPDDLSLESRDTLMLYDAFADVYGEEVSDLEPVAFLSPNRHNRQLLIQADVLRYESALKERFIEYTHQDPPGSKAVVHALEDPNIPRESNVDLLGGLLSLVTDLHARGMLPAILFSFDRRGCEQIAKHLVTQLRTAERSWKAVNPEWQLKLKQWGKWKNTEKTRARSRAKANKARRKNEEDEVREDAMESMSWEFSFDPDMPLTEYSFLGKASRQELEEEIYNLRWTLAGDSWQMEALRRGIAVHHAGMNKHYRNLIENLFRRGIIRIMVSTGTLALGINAPAKTSVFCGDSTFLTALMYRQCAGRAGRRGYDLLGNVVFYALPMHRVQRMVLSRLPSLGGSFPLNTTLTLRLFNLLHGSQNAEVAMIAFQTLMNLPQITFGSSIGSEQLKHHLRFNIEYLRRTRLLTETGVPINLSSIVAHLYYHEPSNFAFVVLLHAGILHTISKEDNPEIEFIRLMSHLFGRRLLPNTLCDGDHFERLRTQYPSRIELDPMREDALKCLSMHAREVRDIFASYVSTYASQCASELPCDTILPLSKVSLGIPDTQVDDNELGELGQLLEASANHVQVRSLFVANSGHTDQFGSVDELARSVRSGIHLNVNAIPNMDLLIKQGEHPLNAYLFDFFMHGQLQTLEKANGIRLGDVWFYLQDFMLVLMTVKTSLQHYLKQASSVEEEPEEDYDNDDDEEDESGDDFPRPPGVSNADWQLYSVVRNACIEFEQKFKAIWA
ncbi:P-loop containing nucleoside triphosphate hydrolase protein [Cylindrobasidium torrendii FP15055 ss-10]|uniref:p-loop containing nucleoside triphosphate hydrolase protein n=1 Tax=Cylindrobasidium torrendii FP15055 ss-10 TaxID=1314674 RepID=A0A0D7BN89_9AGAR|nr:P-loop containing nucleoside triphosphate hydrolase protein [Cylindrobasidium torrendii FP15055 ss-10]